MVLISLNTVYLFINIQTGSYTRNKVKHTNVEQIKLYLCGLCTQTGKTKLKKHILFLGNTTVFSTLSREDVVYKHPKLKVVVRL